MQEELQENENLQRYHEVILNPLKHGCAYYFVVSLYENDSAYEKSHYDYEGESAYLIENNFSWQIFQ